MPPPRISIVTPSLNQGAYLERTIHSVVQQRYPDLEYLLVDGGSTDESPAIIERHASSLTRWERQTGRGHGDALNQGFRGSTGEIMGWLNADDVYLPNALSIVGQIFHDYPHIQWLTSGSINLSEHDELFIIQNSRKVFSRWTQHFLCAPPPQHCTFWRRTLWERAGGHVRNDTPYLDCELWLRFHEHAPLYVADTIFGAWRLHPQAHSTKHLRQLHQQIEQAQRPYIQQYARRRLGLRYALPFMRAYFQLIDRGVLSRLMFELGARRTRLLTYSLRSGRFVLPGRASLLPKAWPLTIELPDTAPTELMAKK